MNDVTWSRVAAAISRATGTPFELRETRDLGGGCINRAVRLSGDDRQFFVKLNDATAATMLDAEREGLEALRDCGAVRVPAPVTGGLVNGFAFLVLEYVPLSGLSGPGWSSLGERLAAMHRATADRFGWHRDNTIGATPQENEWSDHWIEFWRSHRLGYQLRLAADNGLPREATRSGERLMARLDELFAGYEPVPSLLHGDLWGGNVAADEAGAPVLYDPAVYYGDREADIAMTELFGRFDGRFYEAYHAAWPLDSGYRERKWLYNLYHVLNHFNLFGGGYGARAGALITRLLEAG